MTERKETLRLIGERTPSYVDRVTGAAELCISPSHWDKMVAAGELPPPTFMCSHPRWKWAAVERWLAGKRDSGQTDLTDRIRRASAELAEQGGRRRA